MSDKLEFRRASGEPGEAEAEILTDQPELRVGEYLTGRMVRLDGGLELRQHRPATGHSRKEGYERLDNEILAGRRLHELADWTYPSEVSKLYADEATSADPYALFVPYQGRPLREVGLYFGDDEFRAFLISFLTGLCWIAAAGIAHRTINPDTVLWDTQQGAQITDFSRCAIFGAERTVLTGVTNWVPMELRSRTCYGTVGPRDDVFAAGRLILFVRNQGEDLADPRQIADDGLNDLFHGKFDKVLDPPEGRPTARELLEDGLKWHGGLPSAADRSARLIAGRESFLEIRNRKHPGTPRSSGFNVDIDWMSAPGGSASRVNGNDPAIQAVGTQAESTAPAHDRNGETMKSRRFPRKAR